MELTENFQRRTKPAPTPKTTTATARAMAATQAITDRMSEDGGSISSGFTSSSVLSSDPGASSSELSISCAWLSTSSSVN
ncbi:hypothetical protein H4Q26_007133 [Puccinia striiformis f. sp. tritici PST-130]|nr:hypothetical protein H4Q26_007133 [Puccinia striiformis f. sp. tritici PST-130]